MKENKIIFLKIFLVILILFVYGCEKKENELLLEYQLDSLQEQINDLYLRVFEIDIYKTAQIDSSSQDLFQRIDTSVGTFLVVLRNVEPYLDGYKIYLAIGNPYSVSFNNLTFKVKWGKKFDRETMEYTEWKNSLRSKDFSFPKTLNPATWNKIQFILSPSNPEELGYIKLEMSIKTIAMKE